MQIRPEILMIITGILIALAVPSLVYHKVRFKHLLTNPEKAVEKFVPASLTIAKKVWQEAQVTLPVTAPPLPVPAVATPPANVPQAGLAGRAPMPLPAPPKPKITLIVSDGTGGGKAIIDGIPLKVGEQIREWTVERIENSRVLLRGRKGTIWVSQD